MSSESCESDNIKQCDENDKDNTRGDATKEHKITRPQTVTEGQSLASSESADEFQLDTQKTSYLFSRDVTVRVPAHEDDASRDMEFTLVGIFQPKATEPSIPEEQNEVMLPDDLQFHVPLSFPRLAPPTPLSKYSSASQQDVSTTVEKEDINLSESNSKETLPVQQIDHFGEELTSSTLNLQKQSSEGINKTALGKENEGEEMETDERVAAQCYLEPRRKLIPWQPPLSYRCDSKVKVEGSGLIEDKKELSEEVENETADQTESSITEIDMKQMDNVSDKDSSSETSNRNKVTMQEVDVNPNSTEKNMSIERANTMVLDEQPDSDKDHKDDISNNQENKVRSIENIQQIDPQNRQMKTSFPHESAIMESPEGMITVDVEEEESLVEQTKPKEDHADNILRTEGSPLMTNSDLQSSSMGQKAVQFLAQDKRCSDAQDEGSFVEHREPKEKNSTDSILQVDNYTLENQFYRTSMDHSSLSWVESQQGNLNDNISSIDNSLQLNSIDKEYPDLSSDESANILTKEAAEIPLVVGLSTSVREQDQICTNEDKLDRGVSEIPENEKSDVKLDIEGEMSPKKAEERENVEQEQEVYVEKDDNECNSDIGEIKLDLGKDTVTELCEKEEKEKEKEMRINAEPERQTVNVHGQETLEQEPERNDSKSNTDNVTDEDLETNIKQLNVKEKIRKENVDVNEEQLEQKKVSSENAVINTTAVRKVNLGKKPTEESYVKNLVVASQDSKEKVVDIESEKEEGEITSSEEEEEAVHSKDKELKNQESKVSPNQETKKLSVWDRLGNQGTASTKTSRKNQDKKERTQSSRRQPSNYVSTTKEKSKDTISERRKSLKDDRRKEISGSEGRHRESEKTGDSREQSQRTVKEDKLDSYNAKKETNRKDKDRGRVSHERRRSLENAKEKRTPKENPVDTKKPERKNIKNDGKTERSRKDNIAEKNEKKRATDPLDKENNRRENETTRKISCSLKCSKDPDVKEKSDNVSRSGREKLKRGTEQKEETTLPKDKGTKRKDDTAPRRTDSLKNLKEPTGKESSRGTSKIVEDKIKKDTEKGEKRRDDIPAIPRRSCSLKGSKDPAHDHKEEICYVSKNENEKTKWRSEKEEKNVSHHVQRKSSSKASKEHKDVCDRDSNNDSKSSNKVRTRPSEESRVRRANSDTSSTSSKVDSDQGEHRRWKRNQQMTRTLKEEQRQGEKLPNALIEKDSAKRTCEENLKTDPRSRLGNVKEKQYKETRKEVKKTSQTSSNKKNVGSKSRSKIEGRGKTKVEMQKIDAGVKEAQKQTNTDTGKRELVKTDRKLREHLQTETQASHNVRSKDVKDLPRNELKGEKSSSKNAEVKKIGLFPTPEKIPKAGLLPTPVSISSSRYTAIREPLQKSRTERQALPSKDRVALLDTSSRMRDRLISKDIATNKTRTEIRDTDQKGATSKVQTKKRKATQENLTGEMKKRQKLSTDSKQSNKPQSELLNCSELTSKNIGEKNKRERPTISGEIPVSDVGQNTIRRMKVGKGKFLTFKRRHVNQLFIRGDNVVMVAYAS